MSVISYATVLDAVNEAVANIPEVRDCLRKVRPSPAYIADEDRLPLCIISKPRTDTWEDLVGEDFEAVHLGYTVIVALLRVNTFDLSLLRYQAEAREYIRRAIYNPIRFAQLLGTTAYDVEYNPNPSGVEMSALASNISVRLQQFRITITQPKLRG